MRTVFTNGCFDLLHSGHVDLLSRARELGDRLIVGINSDSSVRQIKGEGRPVVDEGSRKRILEALRSVDKVHIFDELTPQALIEEIDPDILVKGGDWRETEIVGADFVIAKGGQVVSMPLLKGYSSSSIIEKIRHGLGPRVHPGGSDRSGSSENMELLRALETTHSEAIEKGRIVLSDCLRLGRTVFTCGNGGGAALAQWFASRLATRTHNGRAVHVLALTTDSSALTAIGNDYGFETVFSRQVEALSRRGDCLVAFDETGNSPSILAAVIAARRSETQILVVTGSRGKKLASLADSSILIPSVDAAGFELAAVAITNILCDTSGR